MPKHTVYTIALFFVGWLCQPLLADVQLPNVFSSQMVLQRDLALPVWGWAEPGERITVRIAGQQVQTLTTKLGAWKVKLKPLKANDKGLRLEIEGNSKLVLENILVGDVWICSGQSNMEWAVNQSMDSEQEIQAANYPAVRLFNVPGHITAQLPQERGAGTWQVCSSDTVARFSAVGYYFARRLFNETKVPIGLIGTNWGGTRIEPWTPPIGFRSIPELKDLASQVDHFDLGHPAGKATWKKYINDVAAWTIAARNAIETQTVLPNPIQVPGPHRQDPTAIYNSMVHPLVPYGVRGALWYQGESNGSEGIEYFYKMQALISGWRQVWNQKDFPFYFYFVQLADYRTPNEDPAGGDGWARIREAQRKSLEIPHTGMAVITDIGEADDIHPRNKQDVGSRLAQWALRDVHKRDVVPSGPLYQDMKIIDNKIRIDFNHVGGGLMVGHKTGLAATQEVVSGSLARFAIAGKDKKWSWAEAVIDGNSVVVSSQHVPEPVAVRYAYSMNPAGANLYNREGFPASPFRTDQW